MFYGDSMHIDMQHNEQIARARLCVYLILFFALINFTSRLHFILTVDSLFYVS